MKVKESIHFVPAYSGFEPHEISWEYFSAKWVPGMTKDGLLVGVNWSGDRAAGYDIEPEKVNEYVESYITT